MKTLVVFFLVSFYSLNFPQKFSELNGLEDELGNTHLFYRIYSLVENANLYEHHNDIYQWDISSGADTLFLRDYTRYFMSSFESIHVSDVEFWNNNSGYYIFSGGEGECLTGFIQRFDSITNSYLAEDFTSIEISKQNDSLLYATSFPFLIKSTDGGKTWNGNQWPLPLSDVIFNMISINKYDDRILYGLDEQGNLIMSSDNGYTSNLLDTNKTYFNDKRFYYDKNPAYNYRITSAYGQNNLIVSNDSGNAFSWSVKFSDTSDIFLSIDYSQAGHLYLSVRNEIYFSNDYGNTFSLYETLEKQLVGIYKKSNSDILYAASRYLIYEITTGSISIIKRIHVPAEELKYYPLEIGTRWVYEIQNWSWDPFNIDIGYKSIEVISDTVLSNSKSYYVLRIKPPWHPNYTYEFHRVDSLTGEVFRYIQIDTIYEEIIHDLSAESGDFFISNYLYQGNFLVSTLNPDRFYGWGINEYRKNYKFIEVLSLPRYSLVRSIGIDTVFEEFCGGYQITDLKGFVKNGILYGDTTVVGVKEDKFSPGQFVLFQNYPNPFNPSTKIKYQIPVECFVRLKVYDILGKEVAALVNENQRQGYYEVIFSGNDLASGIYVFQLTAKNFRDNKKLLLLK